MKFMKLTHGNNFTKEVKCIRSHQQLSKNSRRGVYVTALTLKWNSSTKFSVGHSQKFSFRSETPCVSSRRQPRCRVMPFIWNFYTLYAAGIIPYFSATLRYNYNTNEYKKNVWNCYKERTKTSIIYNSIPLLDKTVSVDKYFIL